MTDDGHRNTPGLPANIEEFNKAAGLVFAQLYAAFPEHIDIDQVAIASAAHQRRGQHPRPALIKSRADPPHRAAKPI